MRVEGRMNTPIVNFLREYCKTEPILFHMPGHKMGKGMQSLTSDDLLKFDITEIPGSDNLHFPDGIIKEAQSLAAKAFGSKNTYFLVNGSTVGILAAILTICNDKASIIVSRDCHKSVINGLILSNAKPIYIKPSFEINKSLPKVITAEQIEKALIENKEAKAVIITSPNYYGVCLDIKNIAKIVHEHGKILFVDEAHGAHLGFSPLVPENSLRQGADICVQSAHKTLPAFTQSAMLHVNSDFIDNELLERNLRLLQTSSPSYLLMASLDLARAIMQNNGKYLLNKLIKNIEEFNILIKKLSHLELIKIDNNKVKQDDTRLVIDFSRCGITGFEAYKILADKYNIHAEMADLKCVVFITTVSDEKKDFEALFNALYKMSLELKENTNKNDNYIEEIKLGEQKVEFGELKNKKGHFVELIKAEGRISLEMLVPYPPGIPIICPGEIILSEHIKYVYNIINMGGVVNGINDRHEIYIVKEQMKNG